jgi:hypothetical protein
MNNQELIKSHAQSGAGIGRASSVSDGVEAHGRYHVACFDAQGRLKWEDDIDNLVTTVGKNDALDKYLAGSAYTAAWYIGLIGSVDYTTGADVTDTSASHAGWVESEDYTQVARPTTAWSAASAGSKALSAAAVFTIDADVTIKGCFLTTLATKGGATGVLYSAGVFTAGDKVVQIADTLNVSYTASLT